MYITRPLSPKEKKAGLVDGFVISTYNIDRYFNVQFTAPDGSIVRVNRDDCRYIDKKFQKLIGKRALDIYNKEEYLIVGVKSDIFNKVLVKRLDTASKRLISISTTHLVLKKELLENLHFLKRQNEQSWEMKIRKRKLSKPWPL